MCWVWFVGKSHEGFRTTKSTDGTKRRQGATMCFWGTMPIPTPTPQGDVGLNRDAVGGCGVRVTQGGLAGSATLGYGRNPVGIRRGDDSSGPGLIGVSLPRLLRGCGLVGDSRLATPRALRRSGQGWAEERGPTLGNRVRCLQPQRGYGEGGKGDAMPRKSGRRVELTAPGWECSGGQGAKMGLHPNS